jgi:hypothetical protein
VRRVDPETLSKIEIVLARSPAVYAALVLENICAGRGRDGSWCRRWACAKACCIAAAGS